ncbi:MAG: hypothetical protein WDO70_10045 [Alphaproteobacteria bacterium]
MTQRRQIPAIAILAASCFLAGCQHTGIGAANGHWKKESIGLAAKLPPAPWKLNELDKSDNGFSLDNFDHRYSHGGIVPPAGAEITVVREKLPGMPVADFLREQLRIMPAEIQTVKVAGEKGALADFEMEAAACKERPQTCDDSAQMDVYVPHGKWLYKFFLNYHAQDSNAQSHKAAFREFLAGVKFAD